GVSITVTPGSARGRTLRAKAASCDTAAMPTFWRRLTRADGARASAAALGLVVVVPLAAFVFAISSGLPGAGALVAGIALVAVAGSGFLYAWRLGAGGLGD